MDGISFLVNYASIFLWQANQGRSPDLPATVNVTNSSTYGQAPVPAPYKNSVVRHSNNTTFYRGNAHQDTKSRLGCPEQQATSLPERSC